MKHLNAYANRTDYEADENRASENTVSFIRDENKVIYNPVWDGTFADPLVGQILFDAGLIADSTYSTKEELALITELNHTFEGSEITKFPELQYCKSLVSMQGAFHECETLTEAPVIPNSVTDLSYAFAYCYNLTEAPVIPNSVTNMESTFNECENLVEAPTITNSVTNMATTFINCTALNGFFVIEAIIPPSMEFAFEGVNVISIKVPAQSVQAYKTASGWSDFADKIFPIE